MSFLVNLFENANAFSRIMVISHLWPDALDRRTDSLCFSITPLIRFRHRKAKKYRSGLFRFAFVLHCKKKQKFGQIQFIENA